MAPARPVFTRETFQFFKELGRDNRKVWMDANRERYQSAVVQPFRRLLEELAPTALELDTRFDTSGRTGPNFSRINRDIRFAKDKTPYRTQMYLMFADTKTWKLGGQLYIGISPDVVTAGFRIYGLGKGSILADSGAPRVLKNPAWLAQQARRLGKNYESYWYSMEKREWTKNDGWPASPEQWKKLKGWVVRRTMKPAAATRPAFPRDAQKILAKLFPLYHFLSLP
ncbi:MAG: DUF2461 family protein [Acidobacteria bacterium]|nr:DUF2461 family protein [Acidobacteriota bacterium]